MAAAAETAAITAIKQAKLARIRAVLWRAILAHTETRVIEKRNEKKAATDAKVAAVEAARAAKEKAAEDAVKKLKANKSQNPFAARAPPASFSSAAAAAAAVADPRAKK